MGVLGDTGTVVGSTGAGAVEKAANWGIKGLVTGAVIGALLLGGLGLGVLALFGAAATSLGVLGVMGLASVGAFVGGKAGAIGAGGIGGVIGAGQGIATGVSTVGQKRAYENELERNQAIQQQMANSAAMQAAADAQMNPTPKPTFDNPDATADHAARIAAERQQQQQNQPGLQA